MSDEKKSVLRGPSLGYTDNFPRRKMWEDIAREMNGKFKIKHTAGHDIEIHNISIPYKNRNIEISVSDSRPLKFRISFSSRQDYELILSPEDFIERIFKKFRKPEIEAGWKEFDKKYLIKSNRSDLVKKTLTKEIQKALLEHDVYSLSYQSDHKSGTAELLSVIQRKAGEKETNIQLIKMFKMLIDNLELANVIK